MTNKYTVEPGSMGHRIVDQYDRTVLSGITTWNQADQMATLLSSGRTFPGRAVILRDYQARIRKERSNLTPTRNTATRPIKGAKRVTTESSRPRGY